MDYISPFDLEAYVRFFFIIQKILLRLLRKNIIDPDHEDFSPDYEDLKWSILIDLGRWSIKI
jgi:hypothetical protein